MIAAAMACGAMATAKVRMGWEYVCVCSCEFLLDIDRKRKIDAYKNQTTKMHTHICHTFGADSKSTFIYLHGYAVNSDANILAFILNKSKTKSQSKKFTTRVWVYLSKRAIVFISLFILWFLLFFFRNCILLKRRHFCKFALMFFQ